MSQSKHLLSSLYRMQINLKKITVGKNDGSVPLSGMIRHHIETLQLVSTFKIKRSINKH